MLLKRRHQLLEGLGIDLHAFEKHAVSELLIRCLAQLPNELEALSMERVLRDVVVCHEEHPTSLVDHEFGGPPHRCRIDHRRLVVGADGV